MRTNIDIDDKLIKSAMKSANISTKKGIVEFALKEVVSLYKRRSILKYKGKMEWVGNLNNMRKTG